MGPKSRPKIEPGDDANGTVTVKKEGAAAEISGVLDGSLPKAVDRFIHAYSKIRKEDQLLSEELKLEPARHLSQICQHYRDLSWRYRLEQEQLQRLSETFSKVLLTVQSLIALASSLDIQALGRQVEASTIIASTLLGLETSTLYCVLVSSFAVPVTLVVEEISLGIVRLLKQCLRQLITPLLSQSSEQPEKGRKVNGSGQSEANAKNGNSSLLYTPEQASDVCLATSALLQALHEFLSRHRLADDQLHQLVHMVLSIYFLPEPHFRLIATAEEVLVTIFGRCYDTIRSSILQEILVRVPRIPTGKRGKKFQIPAAEESADHGLSTWTRLLLRLVQSSFLPLREAIGAEVDFESLMEQRSSTQSVVSQLTAGLLQRLIMTKSKDEELRLILDELSDELLLVAFKPIWPGALAMLRSLLQQLIGLLQPERKREAADVPVREAALKLLNRIVVRLWHTAMEATKCHVKLPEWTDTPSDSTKDARFLQHIALRISLDHGREMPWSEAARAVDAWDAELFLSKTTASTDAQAEGLCSFSDEIVFRYLTMAFLSDECMVSAWCPPDSQGVETSGKAGLGVALAPLSSTVFGASHPIHAWSFLVGDWVEIARQSRASDGETSKVPAKKTKDSSRSGNRKTTILTPIERFLSATWSPMGLVCDSGVGRTGGGLRRVLLPFTVYKVYRQLRCLEVEGIRKAALDCIVMQANSAQASLRKTAMRALSDLVDIDISVLSLRPVEETVDMRLRDESSWVRQVTLDLLGRMLESSLGEGLGEEEAASTPLVLDKDDAGSSASARAMLLRFHRTVRGRINDTSVIVRRQATKILSAFVINNPDHADVIDVTLDLLRRSTDSDALRNLVLGTFELLWFMDDEPSSQAARQLSRVVDAARTMPASVGDLLQELLVRFRKSIGTRKHSKGFEFAIRRWTTLILNEFVQLRCNTDHATSPAKRFKSKKSEVVAKLERKEPESPDQQERWLLRRALLSTLEAFSTAKPKDMLVHLRPLSIYLAVDDDAPSEEQWTAIKVCRIISLVLPYVAERRGLMDHRQVQQDLQALIRNQPSSGVHEAVCCLCLVVKYVTGDLSQLASHLNAAVPALTRLCILAETKSGSLERLQVMYMSRQAWILASILESLAIDDYVQLEGVSPAEQPRRRVLPRSELKFDFAGHDVAGGPSVASTVADILLRMNALGEPQLRAVAVSCMGFFLKGHRAYAKDRRVNVLLSSALASGDLALCRKALETLAALLSHFHAEAEKESRAGASDFADSRDGSVAGGASSSGSRVNSAVESAQPLAAFSDAVLAHISLVGSVGPAAPLLDAPKPKKRLRVLKDVPEDNEQTEAQKKAEDTLKVRIEALTVVRHLQQQGLVNPMVVLPKVFALIFVGDARLSDPATIMMKEMLDLRPALLLNRLDEAFREAFLAMLSGSIRIRFGEAPSSLQLHGLGEVYSERFRRQKAVRESFLRKALKELLRLQTGRFQERFVELAATRASEFAPAISGSEVLSKLPMLQQQQLLYAQFIASAISCLPFTFESEPLLVIFECNHHLSLQAGSLLASHDVSVAAEDKPSEPQSADELFSDAVAILTCVVLKGALKREYGLSSEQCAQYNPKDVRQERLKSFVTGAMGDRARPGAEESHGATRVRFPAAEWCEQVLKLASVYGQPSEIAAYIRGITDSDPWDTNHSRHKATIDRLEGRALKKRAVHRNAGDEEQAAPTPRTGRAKAKVKAKAKIKAKPKKRRKGFEDEDDEDFGRYSDDDQAPVVADVEEPDDDEDEEEVAEDIS